MTFDFSQFPKLETERLILREILPSDYQAIYAIRSDYEVTRYNIGGAYTSVEQAKRLIISMQDEFHIETAIRWGISLKADERVIGMVGYNYWNLTDHRGSVGFDLLQSQWRKGIMSEALEAVIRFGFEEMNLNRIEADASIYNKASMAILGKMGFMQEGIQREQYYEDNAYHDLVLFALLKREWYG